MGIFYFEISPMGKIHQNVNVMYRNGDISLLDAMLGLHSEAYKSNEHCFI